MNKVLVFDTDVGTDDALAFMAFDKFVKTKPDYIVATYGNASTDNVIRNICIMKKIFPLSGVTVKGSTDNEIMDESPSSFHGKDGLGNTADKLANDLGVSANDLTDFISFDSFKEKLKSFDKIDYVAIGPLNNLEILIKDEDIKKRLNKLYVMGGGINEFNSPNDTEFNFGKYPQGVKSLIYSGLDITLFPLDLTNYQRVSIEEIDKLSKLNTYPEFIGFLKFNMSSNIMFNGKNYSVMHDVMPVLYLKFKRFYKVKKLKLLSDEYGRIYEDINGYPINVALKVPDGFFIDKLEKMFANR